MSLEEQIPVHQEDFTSAAIDGARISCATAAVLVELDSRLDERERTLILTAIGQAQRSLDVARAVMPAGDITSLHVVSGERSGIILAQH